MNHTKEYDYWYLFGAESAEEGFTEAAVEFIVRDELGNVEAAIDGFRSVTCDVTFLIFDDIDEETIRDQVYDQETAWMN